MTPNTFGEERSKRQYDASNFSRQIEIHRIDALSSGLTASLALYLLNDRQMHLKTLVGAATPQPRRAQAQFGKMDKVELITPTKTLPKVAHGCGQNQLVEGSAQPGQKYGSVL